MEQQIKALSALLGLILLGTQIYTMVGNYKNGKRVANAEERIADILDPGKVKIGKNWYDKSSLH